MPKRKCAPCDGSTAPLPLNSFDAALDLLVCDTFTRLDLLTSKFEACAGVKLNDGVVKSRWEEALNRYWVMKSMDQLTCSAKRALKREAEADGMEQDGLVAEDQNSDRRDSNGRPLPSNVHQGAIVVHSLCQDEEREWRRWSPKSGDIVLVDTAEDGLWPGKIIDKKTFFQGRTVPRGNHFFPVRIYNENKSPIITIKSRLIPLSCRPTPPLLASPALLSAYHHAANPTTFDMMASARESLAAHNRTHPGVGEEEDRLKIKAEKESWNKQVNWVMNERRLEKLRATTEERERRLREVAKSSSTYMLEGEGEDTERGRGRACVDEISEMLGCPKKRRMMTPEDGHRNASVGPLSDTTSSIFGPSTPTSAGGISTPQRTSSPSLASFIRPALSTPQRPNSPRRMTRSDKRRNGIYTGMGEHSPRANRMGSYTPPRILPSGDETAPLLLLNGSANGGGSPAPTLPKFDFVSPLGPVKMGRLSDSIPTMPTSLGKIGRSGSLEVVREEEGEEEEDGWTVVQKKGSTRRRAGSEPLAEKGAVVNGGGMGEEAMEL
ncbi:hypothetical protein CI109_101618 [Kwoniella shandongensis]|uniref:Uncharacterized protein n=1 Tax=Kwoniella shandongensis TaxID=1734106 RepID=A0A5M6C5R9_9TREE|nr:uncharacterized protein CI109_001257 [Kwoniella shandongensis]KAA5530454.1 hypothetical protein CI109_001257 [Kwoniella shandongensis]